METRTNTRAENYITDYSGKVAAAMALRGGSSLRSTPLEQELAEAEQDAKPLAKERLAAIRRSEDELIITDISMPAEPLTVLSLSSKATPKLKQQSYRFVQLIASESSQLRRRKEPMAERILRTDTVTRLVRSFRQLAEETTQPRAARTVSHILATIKQASSDLPNAPITRLLLAIYDGLAYANQWANLSAVQCKAIADVLNSTQRLAYLVDNQVNRAIVQLEILGLNTIPFGAEPQPSS